MYILLLYMTPTYFSYFQESLLWLKNKTGDGKQNSLPSEQ